MSRMIRRLLVTGIVAAAATALFAASASARVEPRPQQHAARTLAAFTAPDHVNSTFQGCNNPGGTFTLPDGSGKYICPDTNYTTGNLGKNWFELDLVPFRLTLKLGSQTGATTDYNLTIAADASDGGHTGFDILSVPEVNTAKSDSSCTVSADAQTVGPALTGGTTESIYRILSLHQDKGTTCVIDWYQRLGIGAHLFNGSNLQSYMFTTSGFSGSNSTVPLPVEEVGQSLSKDMTATRDTTHMWSIDKSATPTSVDFGNICSPSYVNTKDVTVTITWTKGAATPSGDVHIVTHVYASNPASRTINMDVTDTIYQGSGQAAADQVDTYTVSGVDVAAHADGQLVMTRDVTVSSSATHVNDVAVATYNDLVVGDTPGTTSTSAGADVTTGTESNTTATIQDSESISGTNLSFKAAIDPATPVGSFSGYTPGAYTTGPVVWNSGTLSSSGSVTFDKTIKLDPPATTSGTLSDSATLTPSDSSALPEKTASTSIQSSTAATLTISKTIPDILQSSDTASFTFHVFNSGGTEVGTGTTISFAAGDPTTKTADVTGLPPDTYTVKEDTATGWHAQSDETKDLTGATCSGTVSFTNSIVPATASAVKVTDPSVDSTKSDAPYAQGWTFTLTRPDLSTLTGTTDSNGNVVWSGGSSTSTDLNQEGSYTIAETLKTGWAQISAVGCSFTINYPADHGASKTCTITNKSRGHVGVVKTVNGLAPSGSESFQFDLRDGSQVTTSSSALETKFANAGNGGVIDFTTDLKPGHTYALCELVIVGWGNTFPSPYGAYNPGDNPNYVCTDFSFEPADIPTTGNVITFNVDNTPPPGGNAATIGYWKNWSPSQCKKGHGHQTDQLSPALGSGIALGPYTVTDPCAAVSLLSKENIDGKKQPGDPIYNMVAQLLAADLNVNAGASTCAALTTATGDANTLLNDIGFDGVTSYKGTLTADQASEANSLNTTLDAYNNNNLCT